MRTLFVILGTASVILGVVGIFIPLLPTTPFLLLAAALYFKGSQKHYERLMSHPVLGPYIRNFRENKAIPLRAKVMSVTILWATILYCILFVTDMLWLRILLLAVAAGVTWHILSFRTMK